MTYSVLLVKIADFYVLFVCLRMRFLSKWIAGLFFCLSFKLVAQQILPVKQIDVGVISEDSLLLTRTFHIYNSTNLPLQVDTIYSDCACSLLFLEEKRISPGEQTSFQVQHDIRNRLGAFEKLFHVSMNRGTLLDTFKLRGDVVPGRMHAAAHFLIKHGPLRMLNQALSFGNVPENTTLAKHFFVYNAGEDTISLRGGTFPAYLHLHFLPQQLPPKEVGRWQVTYLPKERKTLGYSLDECLVFATGKDFVRPVKCFVATDKNPPPPPVRPFIRQEIVNTEPQSTLVFGHTSHDFGKVSDEGTLVATFPFQNIGQKKLRIVDIRSTCACLGVKLDKRSYAPFARGALLATLHTKKLSGKEVLNIEVQSTDPVAPTMTLKARIRVTK